MFRKNNQILIFIFLMFLLCLEFQITFIEIKIINYNEIYNGEDIIPTLSSNNPHILEWDKTWSGSDDDYGRGVIVDSSGNIYIVGSTKNFITGDREAVLIKYKSSGVQEWNVTWGGDKSDSGYGIAIDSADNIFIVGKTDSYGESSLLFLAKYDSSGVLQWNVTWGGINKIYAVDDIAIDLADNIYIAGTVGNYDIMLVKYNTTGDFQWSNTWDGGESDYGRGVIVNSYGNIYVTGHTGSFGAGEFDIVLIKYNSSGAQEWYKTWGGYKNDFGQGIAVDSDDNIYVVGRTEGYGTVSGIVLVKFDNSGEEKWYITTGSGSGSGIAVDSYGNIYILGKKYSSIILIKYDSSGVQKGNVTWGFGDIFAGGVAVDSTNNIYVVGTEENYATNEDIFLVKFGIDTDNDGLSDDQEINIYFTDPNNSDTDGDALLDYDELFIYLTDPNNPDTDGDGFNDGKEVSTGHDPLNPYSNPYITMIIIINIIIAIIILISLVFMRKTIKKKREKKEKERMERDRREERERMEREKREREKHEMENYENILNLKSIIRNYVYHQLKAIQNDFKNVSLESLDKRIKNQLNSTIDILTNYLKLEGYPLTQYQLSLLKDDCFRESEPIRDELRKLIKDHLERERKRKEREEQERILREKKEITKKLFGKEIIKKEDIEKFERYKTIDEEIDDLMKEYSAWERKEDKKKL